MSFSSYFSLFWESVRSSWNIWRSRKKDTGLIVLTDVLFFFVFSFVSMLFVGPIFENLYKIGELFSGTIPNEENIASYLTNFSEEAFTAHYTAVIQYVLWLLLVTFVLWVVFQGFVWKKSFDVVGLGDKTKLRWAEFYKRFTFLHVFWAVVFLLLFSLSIKFSLKNLFGSLALLTEQQVLVVVIVLHLLFCYFYMVSLLLVENYGGLHLLKMIFVDGIKKFKYLFVAYLGVLFDLAILFWVFYQLSQALLGSWVASVVVLLAMVVVIVYLSWVRVFLISLVNLKF